MRVSRPWLVAYAALVVAVPLIATEGSLGMKQTEPDDAAVDRRLHGSWWRYESRVLGDPVRFYYFHGDGKGLYRYGRVGLTNTHSFDYEVHAEDGERGTLELKFRKTGEVHHVGFDLQRGEDGREWLILDQDPREVGETRYFRAGPPVEAGSASEDRARPETPAGHMWIDMTRYATGGMGFHFYQFKDAAIDGRGIGWFHRGDFDEWSTEAFDYRLAGDRIEFHYPLRHEHAITSFRIEDRDGHRHLTLDRDPRDYWLRHSYRDAGRSFMAAAVPPGLVIGTTLGDVGSPPF